VATSADFRAFAQRMLAEDDDMLVSRWRSTSRVTRRPEKRPMRWPVTWASRSPRTPGVGRHQRRRDPAGPRERLPQPGQHLRARGQPVRGFLPRIAATGGSVSVSTESEQSAGQGYRRLGAPGARHPGLPVHGHQRVWSGDLFPRCARRWGRPVPEHWRRRRAARPSRTPACAPSTSWPGRPARGEGARPGGQPRQLERQEGRRRADQERRSPVSFPLLNPTAHRLPGSAGRRAHRDRHGRVVKHEHRLIGIDLARSGRP